MIKDQRHQRILSILRSRGVIGLSDLHVVMPEISLVTLRRDLTELAEAGAVRRTRGGATLPDSVLLAARDEPAGPRLVPHPLGLDLSRIDAVILPPVGGLGGEALRRRLTRSRIPLLAESAHQPGGIYLGPDNRAAGRELGQLAARQLGSRPIAMLMVCQAELSNTRERADGFEEGLRAEASGPVRIIRVNGQAAYRTSFRVALDALHADHEITAAFAVNDHGGTALLEAAARAGRRIRVYAMGGESPDFVRGLRDDRGLSGVAAFFPDVVGARGIDFVAEALEGIALPQVAVTPHAILTAENLHDFYRETEGRFELDPERRAALIGRPTPPRSLGGRRSVGFLPHYPAHDWYRVMIQAMETRAKLWGLSLVVAPPHQGIAAEISRLRHGLASLAVDRLGPGQTVILGPGEATRLMAEEMRRRMVQVDPRLSNLTVATNSLDVLHRLDGIAGLKVILTSGEYQAADRCLVGPSLGALFERMRADQAFLGVDGLTPEFGASCTDERLALAGLRLLQAARHRVILADHTAVGVDTTHRIARVQDLHEVITDDGTLPTDRQKLGGAGLEVLVAGDGSDGQGREGRSQTG